MGQFLFFDIGVKRVTLIKLPKGAFFKVLYVSVSYLLIEVKVFVVCENFPYDADEFTGTMAECIIVILAFGSLLIVIRFEGVIVLYNIMSRINKGISKHSGAPFGQPGGLALKLPDCFTGGSRPAYASS